MPTRRRIVAVAAPAFGETSPAPLQRLMSTGFEVRPNPHGRALAPAELEAHVAGAVGLIAGTEPLPVDVLARSHGLVVISFLGSDSAIGDVAALRRAGIAVATTHDAHVDAVAELTVGGLLAVLRGLPGSDASIRRGEPRRPMGRLLRGKIVGLVGFGRVGKAVARLVAPFGATLIVTDVAPGPPAAGDVRHVPLDELLARADVVSLHVPHTPATHHLIGGAALARMKHDAILVNTAAGGLVDEAALAAHLQAHPRSGAYLDVFEREPYTGPLAGATNVVLTAHLGSLAREARERMEHEAVDNLLRVLGNGATL